MKHANILTVPYMQSGTLPVQILVTATNSTANKTVYFKCAAVHSEGGFEEDRGFPFSTPRVENASLVNGTRTHLLSIRPKLTYNGIVNRELLIPGPLEVYASGSAGIYRELVTGATFSVAPTWADVNTAGSAYEYATGGTLSGVGGIVIAS